MPPQTGYLLINKVYLIINSNDYVRSFERIATVITMTDIGGCTAEYSIVFM